MIRKAFVLNLLAMIGVLVFINSCKTDNSTKAAKENEHVSEIEEAICVLHPTEGNNVSGTVKFVQNDSGIVVIANIEGLSPGKHGFHIHECGNCSSPDGKSTGGHFNPEGKKHGGPMDVERHVGDLGNIIANDEGKAYIELLDNYLSFSGDHSIIGRSIIVHAGEDDLVSQPTGNSGDRVASGVIGIAK